VGKILDAGAAHAHLGQRADEHQHAEQHQREGDNR
jgi:hypothetical protein